MFIEEAFLSLCNSLLGCSLSNEDLVNQRTRGCPFIFRSYGERGDLEMEEENTEVSVDWSQPPL